MDSDDHIFKEAENHTVDVVDLADASNQYIAQEVILLIFGLAGIAVNLLLIYIVCYYRKLHTNTNIYLINWAIADIGAVLITISCFRIFSPLFEVPDAVLCFYFGLGCALIFDVMFFMLLLAVDWCLSAYLPRPVENFRKHTRNIVAVTWIFSAVYSVASSVTCSLSVYYLIFHFTLPITFAALLIFVIVLHVTRLVQKCKGQFEYHPVSLLIIPSAFVLCWVLSWINLLLLDIPAAYYIVTETPLFLHPTINFMLVIILDQDFKTCFYQVIKSNSCGLLKPSQDWEESNVANGQAPSLNRNDFVNRHI